MAVHKKTDEIPTDAILLSEGNAIEYQWKVVANWTPEEDVWPFKHGAAILGACSALSGIYINNHYRGKLRLQNYGRFSSYLPIVVLPAIMTTVFHQQFISNDILIGKTQCPICVELRAAGIQAFFSTVYPTFLAPLAGFMFATRHYTYKVPSPVHNPAAVFALWRKLTISAGNTFFGIAVGQAFIAMVVAYFEAKSYFTVQNKLLEMEQEYEEQNNRVK